MAIFGRFRNRGNRTVSVPAISGMILKYLKGQLFVFSEGYETALPLSSRVALSLPIRPISKSRTARTK